MRFCVQTFSVWIFFLTSSVNRKVASLSNLVFPDLSKTHQVSPQVQVSPYI